MTEVEWALEFTVVLALMIIWKHILSQIPELHSFIMITADSHHTSVLS